MDVPHSRITACRWCHLLWWNLRTILRKESNYLINYIFVHLYKDRNFIPDSDRKIASLPIFNIGLQHFTVIMAKDAAITSRGVIGSDRIGFGFESDSHTSSYEWHLLNLGLRSRARNLVSFCVEQLSQIIQYGYNIGTLEGRRRSPQQWPFHLCHQPR